MISAFCFSRLVLTAPCPCPFSLVSLICKVLVICASNCNVIISLWAVHLISTVSFKRIFLFHDALQYLPFPPER